MHRWSPFGNLESRTRQKRKLSYAEFLGFKWHDPHPSGAASIEFVSEQTNVTRDKTGRVIAGNPEAVESVTDPWTFARNTKSRNPNRTLVATDTP